MYLLKNQFKVEIISTKAKDKAYIQAVIYQFIISFEKEVG